MNKAVLSIALSQVIGLASGQTNALAADDGTIFTATSGKSFTVNDTGQSNCYDANGILISCPGSGGDTYGQDAQYSSNAPSFTTVSDGLVLDNNTGLMWQSAANDRVTYAAAESACAALTLGGYDDWRLPNIKELFSIVNFAGTIDDNSATSPSNPYVFTAYFDIEYPTDLALTGSHTVQMMGQTWSATPRPDEPDSNYFMNFLDGHLKSHPVGDGTTLFYRCVRGEDSATRNDFVADNDGTVTDQATGLQWQQANGDHNGDYQFSWSEALNYCESLSLAGHDDWRLPDIKELQSIVEYTDADNAIDTSVFTQTIVPDTGPFFWSSTTDEEAPTFADYMCFGHCWNYTLRADIHGPGAQRSDPKYDNGHLPESVGDQEDLVQANDYVRCVRNADTSGGDGGDTTGQSCDLNGDGGYSAADLILFKRQCLRGDGDVASCDWNGDGKVSWADKRAFVLACKS